MDQANQANFYEKTNSLSKLKKVPLFKRTFSLDQISRSINNINKNALFTKKNIKLKTRKKKEILSFPKKKSRKKRNNLDDDVYGSKIINYHKYRNLRESFSNYNTAKNKNNDCIIFNNQDCKVVLPSIIQNIKINQSYNDGAKIEEDDLLSISGMINSKKLNYNKINKITIHSLMHNGNKNKKLLINNYKKIDHIPYMNDKFKLNHNLKNINKKINLTKKLNKMGLLTRLYHKHSSVGNNNSDLKHYDSQAKEDKEENEKDDCSSNNSMDLGKDLSIIINNNNEKEKLFVTKLKKNNDNIDISKIINRHSNLIMNIKKKNNNIIDKDNKIYINCLLSKVQSEINRDKIVYRSNGKTIYELDKELSYRRIKRFEKIINKVYSEKK